MWGRWIEHSIKKAVEQKIQEALTTVHAAVVDTGKLALLQKEIARLEIERDKRIEEFSRKEREIEHKIGLERKRQEFEIEQAKRSTEVHVREENLKADKDRFKAEMDFQRQRLEGEVGSLREMVQQMMKRIPSAEIFAEIKNHGK